MTSPNEPEAAVETYRELASSLVSVQHHAPEEELRLYQELADEAGTAIVRLLGALANIARERDEAREESERLRASLLATGEACATHLKRAIKAEAGRDAMRTALMDMDAQVKAGAVKRVHGEFYRIADDEVRARVAALVNGEGG